MGRDAVEEDELIGAEAKRRPHGRVELAHGPTSERVDRMVERPGALDGPVGQLLCERPLARVEAGDGALERAVGVGVVLEHAPDDGHRRAAGGRDAHGP